MAANNVEQLKKALEALRNKPNKDSLGKRKVELLNALASAHDTIDPKKTEYYARQAFSLAARLDYKRGISQSYLNMGMSYNNMGNLRKALAYYNKSLKMSKHIADRECIAQSCKCIGNIHADLGDLEKSLTYSKKALRIFELIGNSREIATMQCNIGVTYDHLGAPELAFRYYFKALEVAEKIGDQEGVAIYNDNIGVAYGRQSDHEKALKYMFKALQVAEDIGANECIARTCNNIGTIYGMQNDHKEALKYHRKTLSICKAMGYRIGVIFSHNNIGIVYKHLGNYARALEHQHKSLRLAEEIEFKEGTANCYAEIGSIRLHQNHYRLALNNYLKSLRISESIKEKNKVAECNLNIGIVCLKLRRYDSATTFLHKAVLLARKTGARGLIMNGYKHLCQLFEAQEDFAQAFKYHKKYTNLEREIFNAEKNKQITEMKTKYETEKKEKEAEIYHLKNIKLRKEMRERKRIEKELMKHRDQLEELVAERTAQLRSLAHELSLVEEKQRRQTANYLHDNIGQALSLAIFKIRSLQESDPAKYVENELSEIKEIIAQTNQRTRLLTFEISPPVLYELGLEPAVEWLAGQFEKQHGIVCSYKNDGLSKPLKDEARILLFQAVRELLTNVSKHARAHAVTVSTVRDRDEIRISVEDDGMGFDPESLGSKITHNEGFGLFNIKERLHHLRGKLEINSEKGKGTSIVLSVPLKRTPNKTSIKRR